VVVVIVVRLVSRITVPLSKYVKELVGGKPTLQNETPGDLGQEFDSPPEKSEELPLEELCDALGVGISENLGKYTTGLVSHRFNPNVITFYLSKSWVLGLNTQTVFSSAPSWSLPSAWVLRLR